MWIHEDEESRSAEKAKVVGFPSEWTLERQLADWLADGQGQAPDGRLASRISCNMNCMCVWRVRIVAVNDAESPAYFHNMRVAIQHAQAIRNPG